MIKGISVEVAVITASVPNECGEPINEVRWDTVEDVLVSVGTSAQTQTDLDLTGYTQTATIAIPKADTHNWEQTRVRFFGLEWRTVGRPLEGIPDLIPLRWNKQITVVR